MCAKAKAFADQPSACGACKHTRVSAPSASYFGTLKHAYQVRRPKHPSLVPSWRYHWAGPVLTAWASVVLRTTAGVRKMLYCPKGQKHVGRLWARLTVPTHAYKLQEWEWEGAVIAACCSGVQDTLKLCSTHPQSSLLLSAQYLPWLCLIKKFLCGLLSSSRGSHCLFQMESNYPWLPDNLATEAHTVHCQSRPRGPPQSSKRPPETSSDVAWLSHNKLGTKFLSINI